MRAFHSSAHAANKAHLRRGLLAGLWKEVAAAVTYVTHIGGYVFLRDRALSPCAKRVLESARLRAHNGDRPDFAEFAGMIKMDERWVRIGENRLFAKTWSPPNPEPGDLAPILLFHDSLGCVDLWRSFPDRLAATTGRRVIAYDRLGFGRSDPYPGRLQFDFIATEARRVVPQMCEQLGFWEFIACGHSVGGGMAVETAAQMPKQCRALVTIAAQAFVENKTLEGLRAAQRDFLDPANLARVARYHADKAKWVIDAWIGTWLAPEFAAWNLDASLASVKCPVLAIHGELDEYGSAEHPNRIAAGRGTTLILPKTGHVPHRENERLLANEIGRFLNQFERAR